MSEDSSWMVECKFHKLKKEGLPKWKAEGEMAKDWRKAHPKGMAPEMTTTIHASNASNDTATTSI